LNRRWCFLPSHHGRSYCDVIGFSPTPFLWTAQTTISFNSAAIRSSDRVWSRAFAQRFKSIFCSLPFSKARPSGALGALIAGHQPAPDSYREESRGERRRLKRQNCAHRSSSQYPNLAQRQFHRYHRNGWQVPRRANTDELWRNGRQFLRTRRRLAVGRSSRGPAPAEAWNEMPPWISPNASPSAPLLPRCRRRPIPRLLSIVGHRRSSSEGPLEWKALGSQ